MKRVLVRRLEQRDLYFRTQWYNHPTIYSQVYLDIPFSLDMTLDWYKKVTVDSTRKDFSFELHDPDSEPELIAMGGLVNIDHRHQRAERYFLLNPEMIGKGIGPKLLSWISNYGFISLNLNRLFGLSLSNNERVLKANAKEGWTNEGRLRKSVYYNGQYYDQNVKSILREEWLKMPWKTDTLSFEVVI